jgi:hypothetical protein
MPPATFVLSAGVMNCGYADAIRGSILATIMEGVMASETGISWKRNLDEALSQSRAQKRSVLLDFSAAPM